MRQIKIRWEHGIYGEADPKIIESTGQTVNSIKITTITPRGKQVAYGVVSEDENKIIVWNPSSFDTGNKLTIYHIQIYKRNCLARQEQLRRNLQAQIGR